MKSFYESWEVTKNEMPIIGASNAHSGEYITHGEYGNWEVISIFFNTFFLDFSSLHENLFAHRTLLKHVQMTLESLELRSSDGAAIFGVIFKT